MYKENLWVWFGLLNVTVPSLSHPSQGDEDANADDCTYNSFQYWRVPLPELDLSLLEDAKDEPPTKVKSKVKGSPPDAMET